MIAVLGTLLIAVVVVGLARDNLDPTAVALGLLTAISGVMTGLVVRGKFGGGGDGQ